MSRGLALAFVATVAVGGLVAQPQGRLDWQLPAGGVAVGEPFVAELTLVVPARAEVEAFDPTHVWPVSLVVVATPGQSATGSGPFATFVHRYEARAFAAGERTFAPIPLRVRTDSGETILTVTPPPLRVRSILPEPPGAFEWPGDVMDLPRRSWRWWLGGAAAVFVLGTAWWWLRPRSAAAALPNVEPSPHAVASARIAALALPEAGGDALPFYTQLATIVRDHAAAAFAVPAARRTTDELVAGLPLGAAPAAACLRACDLVKFASTLPTLAAHEEARAAALAFVRATSPAAEGP